MTPADTAGVFDVVARAGVLNTGAPASNVTAQISSSTAGAIVVDGDVTFGNVATTQALKPVRSADTFKVRFILPARPLSWLDALLYARTTLDGLSWRISCDACFENRPPVANAGPDQTVHLFQLVTLDGSRSSDPDTDSLKFSWSIVSAPAMSVATLSDASAIRPTMTADVPGTYTVRLIVNDGRIDSAPSLVTLTTLNTPPVANAGADQTARVGGTVGLDGTGSSDVDGDPLIYEWSLVETPASSAASIAAADPAAPLASFVVDRPGRYVAQLIVRDAESDSAPDTAVVSTVNSRPRAVAGQDQTVAVGQQVQLSAEGSADADGDALNFRWALTPPPGSAAVLVDATGASTAFVADRAGEYLVQLIANDGQEDSEPDTVIVSTRNSAPVAVAEPPDQAVFVGQRVRLDGSGSTDADGDPLSFRWSLIGLPLDSNAVLEDAATPSPSFVADRSGVYVVQLIVGDGHVDSAPSTSRIVVEAPPPEPPRIWIDHPADDQLINITSVVVSGGVDRPATVTVNGVAVRMYGLQYFLDEVELVDGLNHLTIVATDQDGLRSEMILRVHVDRIAPGAPNLPSVTITEGDEGQLVVTGAAGSVEPHALVFVNNAASAAEGSVRADATGAFTLTIQGELGDPLRVRIEDRAGNSSEPVEILYPAELLILRIASPSDLSSIAERSVVLRGEVSGPLEATIAANGLPAAILGNTGVRQFLVQLPLTSGENLISIVASAPNGARIERQLRVTRTGATPFSVEASTSEGIGPLEVSFEINRHTSLSITRVEADLDDDGTIDATQGSRPMPFTHRYAQPGMYRARFTVITADEQAWTYEVPVTVHAASALDARVRAAWGRFRDTLSAGDVPGTLAQMTPDAAERYAPMFEHLRGSLAGIVASFSDIDLVGFHGGVAEYVLAREVGGQAAAFLVYFVQTSDGAWRIASL